MTASTQVLASIIDKKTNIIAKSERITKKTLGEVSLNLLQYMATSPDVTRAEKLLSVLTPANKNAMTAYLVHCTPNTFDEEKGVFGKINKGKKSDKKKQNRVDFIEQGVDVWSFVASNADKVKKPKTKEDLIKHVQNAMKYACDSDKHGDDVALSISELMSLMGEIDAPATGMEVVAEQVGE